MLHFSSIASHLQRSIAEKMDSSDLKELVHSSKHGKEIGKFVKVRIFVEIREFHTHNGVAFRVSAEQRYMDRNLRSGLSICLAKILNSVYEHQRSHQLSIANFPLPEWWLLDRLRELFSEFPRLVVSRVMIYNFFSPPSLPEIEAAFQCVCNKVELYWEDWSTREKVWMTSPGQQIARIAKCFVKDGSFEETLLSLLVFSEIQEVDIVINNIPDASLLMCRQHFLTFRERANRIRIDITANHFFQQWFHKKRDIECFMILSSVRERWNSRKTNYEREETLFSGLPISILGINFSERGTKYFVWKFKRRRNGPEHNSLCLDGTDVAISLNRGDKKLLVLVSNKGVVAQEYEDYKDVIEQKNDLFDY